MKNIRTHLCFVCKLKAKTEKALRRHMKEFHRGVFLFNCHCGKVFNYRQPFEDHVNSIHLSLKFFQCEKGCELSFKSDGSRRTHYSRFHKINK